VTVHPLSQACMFVYSSCGKWVFPTLLWSFPLTVTFTSFPAPDYWAVLLLLPVAMFVYSSLWRWVFPPLLWSFPPSATLTSFPVPGCWVCTPAPTGATSAHPACLFTVLEGFPSPNLWHSVRPPSFPRVFIVVIAYYSVSLFSPDGSGLSRGLCCSGPGLSVGVP
jgi:hypothetical protein